MRSNFILGVILFAVAVGLYAPDLRNQLFFDDIHLIINNEDIWEITPENVQNWFTENAFAGAGRMSEYYRPLLLASYAMNYAIHGIEPAGYFLVNNIIHALNGLLVFWLVTIILKNRWMAFFTALIFLIHPMQSENIAYVAGRGDLLASFFMLLGLVVWFKGVRAGNYWLTASISSFLLVCALFSRENAMIFPFLALVIAVPYMGLRGALENLRHAALWLIPHFAIVGGYFALRLTVLNFRDFLNFGNFDTMSLYAQDIFVRLYTFSHVLLEYLRTFFWPNNVHERFTFQIHESLFAWPVWIGFLGCTALLAWLIYLYIQSRTIRSHEEHALPAFRLWFFTSGWFFVSLLPSSGIIPTNVIIQDHRMYLALIGLTMLVLHYGWKIVQYGRNHIHQIFPYLAYILFASYLLFFAWVTVERAIIWGKPIELFEETLRYEPRAALALNQLAFAYIEKKEFDIARQYLLDAVGAGIQLPSAYVNLGYVYHYGPEKNYEKAIQYYHKVLELEPGSWRAHLNLADLYMEIGSKEAVYHLKRVNELRPTNVNVYYNLARVLHALGAHDEALVWVQKGKILVEDDVTARKAFELLELDIASYQE